MDGRLAKELGQRMCAAWGLNPSDVLSITIEWTPIEMPYAVVRLQLAEGVAHELLTLAPVTRTRHEYPEGDEL